ncbi:CbiX/SirB N-terminal domain-containing protein [Methylomonas sp. UP202]|uniref:sirohydrochlorin chelatase n=1 Tax=Methylomonas sp. UP202 TaxID=3040943 RepID=UPI0024788701|nr:CbiX/SirB N-terminal domain-containing protein [Methylomonas sp. UP202]WGS86544.1 CbiX/SirB N-terminal domain-containing protein [Methylomonas sp. UP202]
MKTMNTHLLLVAHGSRREQANDEIRRLADTLAIGSRYAGVACAFLEIAEPSISDGLRRQIAAGARRIVVLPYFLAAGRHVGIDIPEQVEGMRCQAPEVEILIAEHLGSAAAMRPVLLDLAFDCLGELS